jgi:hypothetical protein
LLGAAISLDQNATTSIHGIFTGLTGSGATSGNPLGSSHEVTVGFSGTLLNAGGLASGTGGNASSDLLYGYTKFTVGPTTAVPEPGSLTLVGIGAVGLIGYGWRRRGRIA